MAEAAVEALGSRVICGLVVSPVDVTPPKPLETITGQHPHPGPGSEAAGRRALAISQAVPASGLLVVLVSGGASSLLAVPAGGLGLDDKRAATGVLLRAGADIYALNTVRKHLSAIKGGRLAAACPAPSVTFVLSDVVGDDLSVVASGPTVADRSTYADALRVIDEFGGRASYPPAVVSHLVAGSGGKRLESPKPGDPRLARAQTTLIGGRFVAMRGAADEAERRGFSVVTIEEPVLGEARSAGPRFVQLAIERSEGLRRPVCVIASGETTVRVLGKGTGGRNQELALSAAAVLGNIPSAVVASVGTDGVDGPTDAAGAIVDSTSLDRAAALGLSPIASVLDQNDSYPYLASTGDLLRTGPTGTNVGDLQVFLLA
jgi:hydroxypyruvate reductase